MIIQSELVVCIKIDSLITGTSISTCKLTVFHYSQFRTRHFGHCHPILLINTGSHIQCFILQVHLLISIIKENKPVFQRLQFKTCSDIKTVTLRICIRSTLQIRNHRQFRKMSIRVNNRYRRTETCQTMIKSFTQTTVKSSFRIFIIKRSPIIRMHKLSVEFQFQPFSQF